MGSLGYGASAPTAVDGYAPGLDVETWELQDEYELQSPVSGCPLGVAGVSLRATYLDLMEPSVLPGGFGGLKVKDERGTCMSTLLAFASCRRLRALATTPKPVSTKAWPLEPALDPSKGISLRAWKLRGLRPRTTMGAVVDSDRTTLELSARVPKTLRCRTKCCWSSFLRPLLAVALERDGQHQGRQRAGDSKRQLTCGTAGGASRWGRRPARPRCRPRHPGKGSGVASGAPGRGTG